MRAYIYSLRTLVLLALLFTTLSLSCRSKPADQADTKKPEPSPDTVEVGIDASMIEPNIPAEPAADNVAVTVNGIDIMESEVDEMIQPQLDMFAKKNPKQPPALIEQMKKVLRQRKLEEMITIKLLDEKVKEANIVVTEEEVMSRIEQIASAQKPPLSLEDFKKKLAEYGQSFDDLKQQLVYQKFMEAQWAGKINITEDDAKKFYDENVKLFETPEQVRASHILIKPDLTDPNTDPNEAKAKAEAQIQQLLKQIKDGADFAELAKANSDCPSAARGGDLDFFPRGRMTQPFEKAAFELEVGQISDIVETQSGYHIIKVTDHKDASTVLFEQAKDDIINELTRKKQSDFAQEYIKSLKAEANIVYPSGKEPSSATTQP